MIEPHHAFIENELKIAGWNLEHSSYITQYSKINFDNISFSPPLQNKMDLILKDSNGEIFAVLVKLDQNLSLQENKIFFDFFVQQIKNIQGFSPFVYFIENYEIGFWDSENYQIRKVLSFHSLEDLKKYRQRNEKSITLSSAYLNKNIADRPYQIDAIRTTLNHFNNKNRSALWVMATGTGKTRTAIALIDILLRQEFLSKILVLVDRKELAAQIQNSLKKYLPSFSKQRIRTTTFNQNKVIYISTYQTMIKLIKNINISQGFFDFIIADESHRSIYKYYGQLFLKFDAIKLGLTATPINFIDRDTFDFFEPKNKKPTFQYNYNEALENNYLCPFEVLKIQEKNSELFFIPTKEFESKKESLSDFRRYYILTEHRYEKIINTFLNQHYLDPITNRPRKTIFYVKNKLEAYFVEKIFNDIFRQNIAKAIVSGNKNASILIKEFADTNSELNIAISVDILTTGIDIPNIINLIFAKPIYSYVTFWQMIGRGTRLYDKEFKKEKFYIFDIYKNFDYFKIYPKGIEPKQKSNLLRKLYNVNLHLYEAIEKISIEDPRCEILKEEIIMQVKSLPQDDLFIKKNLNTLAECIDQQTNSIVLDIKRLSNISQFFDRINAVQSQDIKFRIKIKKLQYSKLKCTNFYGKYNKNIQTFIDSILIDIENLTSQKDLAIIDPHRKLLEKVSCKAFWQEADFHNINRLLDILAPLMVYKLTECSIMANYCMYWDDEIDF